MTSRDHPTATITTLYSTLGQSGRFGSEQVAAFRRNRWPLSSECAAKIKEFRGIATRYDKTDTSYGANLNLVATVIAMR